MEGTTFINHGILAADCGDQNQEQAFQIQIVKRLQKHSSVSFETWRLHLFIRSRKNMLKFPKRYSVSERGSGDVFSSGPHSADLSGQRFPPGSRLWVEWVPSAWRQLSEISFHRCRPENKGQASSARTPQAPVQGGGGGSIPMPITWPLWHKSLLIILILNIKLK